VGVQPTVQHSDSIIETVGGTDRYERLTAADSAGAAKGMERREGKLRFGERQSRLVA
jgi:hypothetical protein